MNQSGPRAVVRGLLFLLLLSSLLATSSAAQLPGVPDPAESHAVYGFQMTPDRGGAFVPFLRNALVNITIDDLSVVHTDAASPVLSQVFLSSEIVANNSQGWLAALEATAVPIRPGESRVITLNIQAGATVVEPVVHVRVHGLYRSGSGQTVEQNLTLLAVAQPSQFVNLQLRGIEEPWRPDEQREVDVQVRNDNYYPDMITFSVTAPDGWVVSPPSTIRMDPGETRLVTFDIKAPQDRWILINPTSEVILVTAESASSSAARYTVGIPAPLSGVWLPGWVVPHIFLFFLGLLMLVRVTHERREERRLEKGKPQYPGIAPEEEARLAALKRTEPDRAEAMEERLHALHKRRVKAWRGTYKKRKALEGELAKREKARHDELIKAQKREARRARKEEKAALAAVKAKEKALAKRRRKLEKGKVRAQRKADKLRKKEERAQAKRDAKEAKRREKQLAKLQKKKAKFEKKQGGRKARKAAKREAKGAKRREKQLAKLQKKKAKLEKRQAKTARKEERAEEKADKPGLLGRLKGRRRNADDEPPDE